MIHIMGSNEALGIETDHTIETLKPASDGTFNFHQMPERAFAKNYLATYYSRGLTLDEERIADALIRLYPEASGDRLLEIGCGPTLHHLLPAAEHFHEIHVADYLTENLDEIRLWQTDSLLAHDWRRHTQFILEHEGKETTPEVVKSREDLLRRKLTCFLNCDLLRDAPPLGLYPAVGSFFCSEEVGISKNAWQTVVSRIAAHVAPGGYLFMSALRGSDFYSVVSQDGTRRNLPCANINENDFLELLPRLGFPLSKIWIESGTKKGQEIDGVFGFVIVAAQRDIQDVR